MFERFTQHAHQVIVVAEQEARRLRSSCLGTEHILLGLLGDDAGIASKVLENLGVSTDRVRAEIERTVVVDEPAVGQIPLTPRAEKVLDAALREAFSLRQMDVGAEHILLGLVYVDEGVATRILLEFRAYPGEIRDAVITMLSEPGGQQEACAGDP
jgi:ATP-dependent Clp protease ATP-binding subunit ClpC